MDLKPNSVVEPWEGKRMPEGRVEISTRGDFAWSMNRASAILRAVPALVTRRAPGSPHLGSAVIRRLAEAMLGELALESAELSVLLTDDAQIHALNLRHRAKDRPTDVLAFPLQEDGTAPGPWLGDVVISLDTAQRQADSRRRPLLAEVRFLLAHGLLHLIGYDHDTRPRKREMDAMARRLVRSAPLEPARSERARLKLRPLRRRS